MSRKNIGIISDTLPNPPWCPGCPRLFCLMREWAKEHRITYVCIGREESIPADLKEILQSVVFVDVRRARTVQGRIIHRMVNAPYFLAAYNSPAYLFDVQDRILKITNDYGLNHLHANQLSDAQFIPRNLKSVQTSIDVRDAIPLVYRREARIEPRFGRKIDLKLEALAIGHYLKKLSRENRFLTVVAKSDADYLKDAYGVKSVVIPNGVDFEYYHPKEKEVSGVRPITVFTGVMDYAPNVDTAVRFAREVFPIAKGLSPELEFHIVGAKPTEQVRSLESVSGVRVLGQVDDMRPYLWNSAVFVCPMRTGSGIKNKILAAMAADLPVVASRLGIAGVDLVDGEDCLIREDPSEFASALVELINNRELRQRLITNARNKAKSNYSWSVFAERYLEELELSSNNSGARLSRQ